MVALRQRINSRFDSVSSSDTVSQSGCSTLEMLFFSVFIAGAAGRNFLAPISITTKRISHYVQGPEREDEECAVNPSGTGSVQNGKIR